MVDRLKRPLERDNGRLRDASLMIIASEGEKTEDIYFNAFQSKKLQIVSIPSEGGRSSPTHVLDALELYIKKFDFGDDDEFWMVIDRDRWTIATMSSVRKTCAQKGIGLAVSNPSFEIWLAFHFPVALPADLKKRSLKAHLTNLMGSFSKSSFDPAPLIANAHDACLRAKENDVGANDIWPDPPGSRVYLLMGKVLECLAAN